MSQASRSMMTLLAVSEAMERSTILGTMSALPCASSSLAAVIQMLASVGICWRALFRMRRDAS